MPPANAAAIDPSRQLLPFRESLLAITPGCMRRARRLDQVIVGTAMPRIVAELKGFDLYAWVATSYMLASVITIPIFGRLGDLYGRKRFLVAAIVLFTVASVMCGRADSMLLLVIARGVQGIGGGILIGTIFASVADLFPDAQLRLRWLVFVSTAFGVANIIGRLGKVLTQHGGWRLVFFVNVPVGVVSLLFVRRYLPNLRPARAGGPVKLDWLGGLVIAMTFGALQLLIEFLPNEGLNKTTAILAAVAFGGALTLWFWEKRMGYPILPVDMLVDRKLSALFAMSLLGGFALFSLVFYVPLLFQGGYAMSPDDSGMLITPLVIGTTIGTVANNRIVTHLRRANMHHVHGLCALCDRESPRCRRSAAGTAPHLVWMSCMGASGVGLGLVAANLTIFSQQIVTRDNLGAATALLQSLRTFGGMLGTAITGALLGQLYVRGVHRSLDSYQATQWFKSFASPELLIDRKEQAALVSRLVSAGHAGDAMMNSARDALVESIHVGLALAAAAAVAGLCLAWFVPPVHVGRIDADADADAHANASVDQ